MSDDEMMTSPMLAWYQWPLSESGNSQSRDPEVSSIRYVIAREHTHTHTHMHDKLVQNLRPRSHLNVHFVAMHAVA